MVEQTPDTRLCVLHVARNPYFGHKQMGHGHTARADVLPKRPNAREGVRNSGVHLDVHLVNAPVFYV